MVHRRNYQKSSVYFPRIHKAVSLTKHCISRMKQRAGLNTREKRKKFLRNASNGCLMLYNIPKDEQFEEFIAYMKGVAARVRRKNAFCYVYLYSDYFLIISSDGKAITIINVDPKYKGSYKRIIKFFEERTEIIPSKKEVYDDITKGDDDIMP
nr:MAG TPA: hypothetical protein [Caudoviricetes sp.]